MRSLRVVPVDIPAEAGGCLAMNDTHVVVTVSEHLTGAEIRALLAELITPDVFSPAPKHLRAVI